MRLHPLAKLAAAILAVLPAPSGIARGHPHVWVDARTAILVSPAQEITGFRHKWTFDEMYSAFAINGLDSNGDGVYSEKELQPLAQTNIEALKDFEYFTFAFLGKVKLPIKAPPHGYRLKYKNKLLTLYFTVALASPVPRAKFKDFNLAIYDPGMYVALTLDRNAPVKIVSAKPLPCTAHVGGRPSNVDLKTAQLGENIDPASNFGMRFAERITIDCK
jgi:ABC-type uncharacterized transport system substrate-binding protein